MSSAKQQPRAMEPGGLESKFALMIALPFDTRVTRKHVLVYGFILDWWHRKYGDALASVRHIVKELKARDPAGRGLFNGDVHSALNDLVAWGYLSQQKGSGRLASRYTPVWDRSVREIPNTSVSSNSVREAPNTDVRESPNATLLCVQESPNEDPSTVTRFTEPGNGIDGLLDAPSASAGPDGLASPVADGFERLWRAYGVRRERKAARVVFDRLAPGADELEGMIAAATAWKAGAGSIQRKALARWLEEERWYEDVPQPFQTVERLAKAPKKSVEAPQEPANDNTPAKPLPQARKAKSEVHTITTADIAGDEDFLDLILQTKVGGLYAGSRTIALRHRDPGVAEDGLRKFAQLCSALAIKESVTDAAQLTGHSVLVHTDEAGQVTFHPPLPSVANA